MLRSSLHKRFAKKSMQAGAYAETEGIPAANIPYPLAEIKRSQDRSASPIVSFKLPDPKPVGPINMSQPWTSQEIAAYKKKNGQPMPVDPTQGFKIPDLLGDQENNDYFNQDQVLANGEVQTSTPNSIQTAANLSNQTAARDTTVKQPNSFWNNVKQGIKAGANDLKENWQDYSQMGLQGALGAVNYADDMRKERQLNESIQQRQSKPVYDYNYMYGRTTSGGTEYQPTIMAKEGAKITGRYNTPEGVGNNVEIESGEFLILPDGTTEMAQGPKHSDSYKADGQSMSGINTTLPENTMVFSNHMKPKDLTKLSPEEQFSKIHSHLQAGGNFQDLDMNTVFSKKGGTDSNKTFAQIAKRYDNTENDKILKNPFSKDVDKQTALLMKERNDSVLKQLFKDQQFLNGNSTGEQKAQDGAMVSMQDAGQFINPTTKLPYNLPKGTTVKEAGDKSAKAGDYVKMADGTIKKVGKIEAKRVREASKSSVAANYDEGKGYINSWANESPENKQKVDVANAAFARGVNEGTVKLIEKGPKKGQYEITGKFKPTGLEERLALSEVINKSGKGFGTDKYQIGLQTGTEGYSGKDPKTGVLKGTGSFVAGFTPDEYEQRMAYSKAKAQGLSHEEAIKLAETQDPKQKAENRKGFLKEIGMNTEGVPDDQLLSSDFYKNRYKDVTGSMEKTFNQGDYRPSMGNDALSGWEHYDAINFQGTPNYEEVPDQIAEQNPAGITQPVFPEKGKYQKTPYDISQAVPGAYALAQSQDIFPYAIPEVDSPYIKPQTLNIQSELQDIDNMGTSALRAGADPNMTYAMGLDAKNKAFQTKQNYDAEGRWKADSTNFDAELKTNAMNAELFNKTYNDMYATAKSNQSEAKQAALTNLVESRAQYNQDENMKEMYHNNFVNSYNWDPKTNSWTTINPGKIVDYNKPVETTTQNNTKKTAQNGGLLHKFLKTGGKVYHFSYPKKTK